MTPSYVTEDGELLPINWKTPYNHNTLSEAKRTAQANYSPSKTQQHGREEADINVIVERFLKTGQAPQVQVPPQYGDFRTEADYHELQNRLADTNAEFYKLPAAIRASYQNDPGAWLEDVHDKLDAGDRDSLRKMGISLPEEPQEAPKPPIADKGAPDPKPAKTDGKPSET